MEPRVASWRYQKGRANLLSKLQGQGEGQEGRQGAAEDEDEFELSAEVGGLVEDLIELLLTGLRDRDTIVRWSSAKASAPGGFCVPVCTVGYPLLPSAGEAILSS